MAAIGCVAVSYIPVALEGVQVLATRTHSDHLRRVGFWASPVCHLPSSLAVGQRQRQEQIKKVHKKNLPLCFLFSGTSADAFGWAESL